VITQPAPQLGLPDVVGVQRVVVAVGVTTAEPVADHGRPLGAVRREQAGQLLCDGHPAPLVDRAVDEAEVAAERAAPRLGGAPVDHLEQGPRQPVLRPRVVVGVDAGPGGDCLAHEPAG
jgi:hypothetical protein